MDLAQFHEVLLNSAPQPEHLCLYGAPTMRGFRENAFDRKRFLAVIVLALWLARPVDGEYRRVLLFVPVSHERWAVDTLRVVARHILSSLKERRELYDFVVKAITNIQMGSKILGIAEPDLWVTYGFGTTTPVPDWLPPKAIEVDHASDG